MAKQVTAAFNLVGIQVPADRILPTKKITTDEKSAAFRRILASIKAVGLIEPLIVFPQGTGKTPTYSLLDGHIRFEALKKLRYATIPCLISTDDESYTYNHKVNVMPPIHEHFMILKAIESGVSEDRIAAALDVDVVSIRQKRDLLNGICPEAVELLKSKPTGREALREFRKVKPIRQIEMAELMIKGHNYSAPYAKCLLAATSDDQLVEPHKPKAPKGIKPSDLSEMEHEMEALEQNFLALENTHGTNVFQLMLATTYLRKLFDNQTVSKFLLKHHPDVTGELQKIVSTSGLE